MKTIVYWSLLALIFASCNKEVSLNKKIDGEWGTHSLKLIEPNGLSYYVSSNGTITFSPDGKKSTKGTYSINISYDYNGVENNVQENGTYQLEGDKLVRFFDSMENESRVVYVTSKDLEFEIPNLNNRGLYFVLDRD